MNVLKRILTGVGGITLVAVALQLVAPKAVHSTVAALVSVVGNVAVTNPTAASGGPQPLVTQGVGEVPSTEFSAYAGCHFAPFQQCSGLFSGMPAQSVVVTDVSGTCVTNAYVTSVQVGGDPTIQITPTYLAAGFGYYYYSFGRQTNFLVPYKGTGPGGIFVEALDATDGSCEVYIVGHTVAD